MTIRQNGLVTYDTPSGSTKAGSQSCAIRLRMWVTDIRRPSIPCDLQLLYTVFSHFDPSLKVETLSSISKSIQVRSNDGR